MTRLAPFAVLVLLLGACSEAPAQGGPAAVGYFDNTGRISRST